MNKSKRLISQALFWLVVWLVLWLNQQSETVFVRANILVYLLQIGLIFALIYYAAPKLFLKKKYFYFSLFSIIAVCLFAYFSSDTFSPPKHESPPPHRMEHPNGPHPRLEPPPPPILGIESNEQLRRPTPVPQFVINLLMLSLSYILAALIEAFLYVKKKEEETILIKNENLQNELKLLKSQINPHFLFNSLNNIYALSAIDSGKTQQSISHLSNMLRYVLYECEQEEVPLRKEIKYIQDYLRLFALKSSEQYPIATHFEVQNNNLHIAPMLLIPFIENALKHSNIENKKASFIDIKLVSDNESIQFEVCNSLAKATINKDSVGGIGLENVRKRLAILYPEKHELITDRTDTYFKIKLYLKLK